MSTSVPTTQPPGKGWRRWDNPYGVSRSEPYDYVEVEVWREGYQETVLIDPHNCNPFMNVVGLYWRPAGPPLTEQASLKAAIGKLTRRY
jgi:hypothetical protein